MPRKFENLQLIRSIPAREAAPSPAAGLAVKAGGPACALPQIGCRTSFDHRSAQFSRFKRIIKFPTRIKPLLIDNINLNHMTIIDQTIFNNLEFLLTYKMISDGLPSEPSNSCLQKPSNRSGSAVSFLTALFRQTLGRDNPDGGPRRNVCAARKTGPYAADAPTRFASRASYSAMSAGFADV